MADLFGTYSKRIKLTISNTNIDAELTWFPITVFLTSAQGEEVFAEFDADGDFDRVAFTTSDESTQLYADCELFDDSESKAIYHVSKTGWAISNTGTTDFYMYYDDNAGHNTTYISKSGGTAAQSAWDGNFKAVYHMNDGASTSAIYDSTSNNNDGTKEAANEPIEATGKVGKGQDFDGTNDRITVANNEGLDALDPYDNSYTLEFIVNAPEQGAGGFRILEKWVNGVTGYPFSFQGGAGATFTFAAWDGTNNPSLASPTAFDSTYKYFASIVDHDTDQLKISLNGGAFTTETNTITGAITNAADVYIGNRGLDTTRPFDGILDEIRISSTNRSASWLKATYNSLWDTLLTYGSEETGAAADNAIFFSMNF